MTSDDELLGTLPHLQMNWNTPLSVSHADELLKQFELGRDSRVVDLGCGWGGLLLRALSSAPGCTGKGVDHNPRHIERARTRARVLGLENQVRFLVDDIVRFGETCDRLICIGADHAWGTVPETLSRLRSVVEPGGRLLFGCGHLSGRPSSKLIDTFGPLLPSLPALRETAESTGWVVLSTDAASLDEWDEFETTWNQDLRELADREPRTDEGLRADRLLSARRAEYEHGYRGILGFTYAMLAPPSDTR